MTPLLHGVEVMFLVISNPEQLFTLYFMAFFGAFKPNLPLYYEVLCVSAFFFTHLGSIDLGPLAAALDMLETLIKSLICYFQGCCSS